MTANTLAPAPHRSEPHDNEDTRRSLLRDLLSRDGASAVIAIAVVMIAFQMQNGLFISPTNINNLSVQITPLVFVAVGVAILIMMKEIDLSLAALAGLTSSIGATMLTNHEQPWVFTLLCVVLFGALFGALQGLIVVLGNVPSFVVTLGGFLAFTGLQLNLLGDTGGVSVYDSHVIGIMNHRLSDRAGLALGALLAVGLLVGPITSLLRIPRPGSRLPPMCKVVLILILAVGGPMVLNRGGGVPLALVLTLGAVGAVATVLRHTASGRHVYAIGSNPEAPRRAGVRVKTIRILGFASAGVFASFAGVAYLSYNQGASTTTGTGPLLLEAIGAAVIGGVSLYGGRGTPWGALFGAIVLGGISNGLDFTNHPPATKYIVEGIIVVGAALLDSALRGSGSVHATGRRMRATLVRLRR
jgi:D-xylose transport system permease protein